MRTQFAKFILFSAATISLVACGQRALESGGSKQKVQEALDSIYAGGQPGSIIVSGAVVGGDEKEKKLDSRIKIVQQAGVGKSGKRSELGKKVQTQMNLNVKETKKTSLQQTDESKEYINIGCADIRPADITGLTELKKEGLILKSNTLTVFSAAKIFICGKQNLTAEVTLFEAQEITLKDAEINLVNKVPAGGLSLLARTLFLEGKNSLNTKMANSEIATFAAGDINLNVDENLKGEGTLTLSSEGSSYQKAEDTKKK